MICSLHYEDPTILHLELTHRLNRFTPTVVSHAEHSERLFPTMLNGCIPDVVVTASRITTATRCNRGRFSTLSVV